jgi:DNA-binding transcriptional LysR family regulator
LNIERLKVFKTVAELKSFTRAAEELFMTQPAISKNIKLVEKFYGVILFNRIGNQIVLTEAGNKLLVFANDILRIAEEAKVALQEDNTSEDNIVLGAGSTVGVYILPQLLEKFVRIYPKIQFTLEISNAKQIVDKFMEGSIDVGVVGALAHKTNLSYFPFLSEKLQLIVSNNHQWSKREHVTVPELKKQTFFLREKGSGQRFLIEERLNKAGIVLKNITELPNNEAIFKLVESGLGVSIISENVIAEELRLNRVSIVKIKDVDLKHDMYVLYRDEKSSKPYKKFISFLRNNQSDS